jgi:hypothetical protein
VSLNKRPDPGCLKYSEHDILFEDDETKRVFAFKPRSNMHPYPQLLSKLREIRDETKRCYPDKYEESMSLCMHVQ